MTAPTLMSLYLSLRWLMRNMMMFSNWWDIYRGNTLLKMRNGLSVRIENKHDVSTIYKIFGENIYGRSVKHISSTAPVIVDIGANIGAFALQARQIFPHAIVVAIEPAKKTCDMLAESVSLNDAHIIVEEAAVAGSAGTRVLFHADTNNKHSLLDEVGDHGGEPVRCITLDSLIDQYGTIDLLKLNCEGAELEICAASEKLAQVELIAVECHRGNTAILDLLSNRFEIIEGPIHRVYTLRRKHPIAE